MRNGTSRESVSRDWPGGTPQISWRAKVGIGFSAVSVATGRAVTVGNQDNIDTVYCFDAATGDPCWKFSYASALDDKFFEGGPTATPTIAGDHVYGLGRQGDLFCLKLDSGEVVWQLNIAERTGLRVPGWGFAGSPVVFDDLLLLTVGEAGVAVRRADGAVAWQSADHDAGYATPVVFTGGGVARMLVPSSKYFHCLDPRSGREIWRLRWLTQFGCNAADPVVLDGRAFLSSGYNRGGALIELNGTEPTVVWKTKQLQCQFSSPVFVNGLLFGIDGDDTGERRLKCLDPASGEARWEADGVGSGSLIAAAGELLILAESGELLVAPAAATAFAPRARGSILDGRCWTAPSLAAGALYARNADGELVAVKMQ